MAWPQALLNLAREDVLSQAMLAHVLPRTTPAHERVSAALAARLLCGPPPCDVQTLTLVVPPGDRTALSAAAGLLIADFFHRHRPGRRLDGHLLLVTPGIGEATERLSALEVAEDTWLPQLWPLESFSRYQPFTSETPHVLLANPGWITRLADGPGRIGAAVIDATHPQTGAHLPELLRRTDGVPLRILVTPPVLGGRAPTVPAQATWWWGPGAQRAAAEALRLQAPPSPSLHSSAYVTQDAELDAALTRARGDLRELMGLMRPAPRALLNAWGLYHRLRQMTVPLHDYERAARRRWGGMMLRDQLTALETEDLPRAALQGPWTRLIRDLQAAYALLEVRAQSAKFAALQQRLHTLLAAARPGAVPVQVLTAGQTEVEALRGAITARQPDLLDAELAGRLEFLPVRSLARRAHTTPPGRVIWPGYPHGAAAALGLYPRHEHEYLLYPHELPALHASLAAGYAEIEQQQTCAPLRTALHALHVPTPAGLLATPISRPALRVLDLQGAPLTILSEASADAALDLDDLAAAARAALDALQPRTLGIEGRSSPGSLLTPHLFVHFEDGAISVPVGGHLDVFYPDTEKLLRVPAAELRAGMRVIVMVDDAYSTIFDRLVEVLDSKLPATQRLLLQLWAAAKTRLATEHPNIRELWRDLRTQGLSVDYTTLRSWLTEFGPDPQQFPAMRLVAAQSGVYPKPELIEQTFTVISSMRGRNRAAGRALHAVLRAIATGDNYRAAMQSARDLDRDLAELLGAAELRTITHVTHPSTATSSVGA